MALWFNVHANMPAKRFGLSYRTVKIGNVLVGLRPPRFSSGLWVARGMQAQSFDGVQGLELMAVLYYVFSV